MKLNCVIIERIESMTHKYLRTIIKNYSFLYIIVQVGDGGNFITGFPKILRLARCFDKFSKFYFGYLRKLKVR